MNAADMFVDAGMLAADEGVLPAAGRSLADQLIAEGHADILAELTAQLWMANEARKARADRWAAHGAAWRAAFDPGEAEPPPPPKPPTKPTKPPATDPPPTDPPSDRGGR